MDRYRESKLGPASARLEVVLFLLEIIQLNYMENSKLTEHPPRELSCSFSFFQVRLLASKGARVTPRWSLAILVQEVVKVNFVLSRHLCSKEKKIENRGSTVSFVNAASTATRLSPSRARRPVTSLSLPGGRACRSDSKTSPRGGVSFGPGVTRSSSAATS